MVRRKLLNRLVRGAFLAVVGFAVLTATRSIHAADEKPIEEDKAARSVEAIALAESLIRFGRASNNPEALILAVRILHQNPTAELTASVDGGTKAEGEEVDLKGLIAEARTANKSKSKLREEDEKAIDALIDRAANEIKEETRGAVGGAKHFGGVSHAQAVVVQAGILD